MILLYNYPEPIENATETNPKDDGFIDIIVQTMPQLEKNKCPILAYYANNFMRDIENSNHSSKSIEVLNERGLHIFLGEPLCLYNVKENNPKLHNKPFNFGFYSEFSDIENADLRAAELDSILKYVERNGLTNVHVYTCDYNVEKFMVFYKPHMNLYCNDMFINSFTYFENIKNQKVKQIKKRFITTNWRYTSARAVTSAILTEKDSHISWLFRCDYDVVIDTPWIYQNKNHALSNRIYDGLKELNRKAPLVLDMKCEKPTIVKHSVGHWYPEGVKNYNQQFNPVSLNKFTLDLKDFYIESFVDIVNESRYAQPTANVSEKVYQSMQFLTPFILVAPPNSLEYLRSLGFKTFSDWWDESYDEERDHWKRLCMIVDLIDEIDSWPYDKINGIYNEMFDVLQFNFNRLIETSRNGELCEIVPYDPDFFNVQYRSKDI